MNEEKPLNLTYQYGYSIVTIHIAVGKKNLSQFAKRKGKEKEKPNNLTSNFLKINIQQSFYN